MLAWIGCVLFKQVLFLIVSKVGCFSAHTQWICHCYEYYHLMCGAVWVSPGLFSSKLLCVFCPSPSEPGRRWLRSHPQQQVLCFQDCQQRQFLSLPYQWQESHIQRSGGFTPKPWYWPRPQQISDLTGNFEFFNLIFSSTFNYAF